MLGQQVHIVALDLLPVADGQLRVSKRHADAFDRLSHPVIVEGDAFSGELADRMPVTDFKAALRLLGVVTKQGVMAIESALNCQCDGRGIGAVFSGQQPVGGTTHGLVHQGTPVAVGARVLAPGNAQRVSAYSSRPISMRRISEVPAPIS